MTSKSANFAAYVVYEYRCQILDYLRPRGKLVGYMCDHFNFIGRCDSKMIRLVSDVWLIRPASLASLASLGRLGRLGSLGDVNGGRNSYLINLLMIDAINNYF